MGIVRKGAVELSRPLNGRRVVLQILGPGDVVGDVGVFLRLTAPYDGVALEDTVLLTVESVRFDGLLDEWPRLARRWMLSVSSRLISYQARLMELLAGGLEAQIASVFVRRAEHGVVRLSQSNLAESACATARWRSPTRSAWRRSPVWSSARSRRVPTSNGVHQRRACG